MSNDAPLRSWLPYLIIIAIAWGSSFLFINLALRAFTPTQIAFGRVAIGAVVLLAMVAWTRNWPKLTWKKTGAIAIVGICLSGAPMVLIPLAQQQITSILASLLNATTPLWTAFFVALLIPHERATRAQVGGLLAGAFGIAILLGAWEVEGFPLAGALLMIGATACYGIGSTLSRILLSRAKDGPMALSATQVALSAVMLAPLAFLSPAPEPGAFAVDSVAMWGLILLGVLGTSFAYMLLWHITKVAGATTATSVTYLVPIVATTLGIVILGEELKWHEPVGAAVVLAGVWFAGRKPRKAAPPVATVPGTIAADDPHGKPAAPGRRP